MYESVQQFCNFVQLGLISFYNFLPPVISFN